MRHNVRQWLMQTPANPAGVRLLHVYKKAWEVSRKYRYVWFFTAWVYVFAMEMLPVMLSHTTDQMSPFFQHLFSNAPPPPVWLKYVMPYLVIPIIQLPLLAGIWYAAICRAQDQPIHISYLGHYFRFFYIVKNVNFLLWLIVIFIVPIYLIVWILEHQLVQHWGYGVLYAISWAGIVYLIFSYMFAIPLMAVHQLKAGEALSLSRRVVTSHWLNVFFILAIPYLFIQVLKTALLWDVFFFLVNLATDIKYVTVGIFILLCAAMWYIVPWYAGVCGVLYRILFGTSTSSKVSSR